MIKKALLLGFVGAGIGIFCASTAFAGEQAAVRAVEMQKSATLSVPSGTILIGPEKGVCDRTAEGALRYSVQEKTLMLCDGTSWKRVVLEPGKDKP